MAKKRLKIGILFGGKSAEHEVSLQSARNVINSLDKNKYEVVPMGITKEGRWLLSNTSNYLLNSNDPKLIKLNTASREIVPINDEVRTKEKIDVIFPVMHGPFGEDGSMQGLLKLAGVPFVGAGVLGSAVGMDKEVMKRLLRDAGLPVNKFLALRSNEKISYTQAKKKLGNTVFIKPANMGSSVGVSKARNEREFKKALAEAFKYDTKILIEEYIPCREIECAVLGNDTPIASVPGEIIANQEFYSYDAKYIDKGAVAEIPAKIPQKTAKKIRELAVRTFKALECAGLGRVDFFLTKKSKIYVNEINTIPGFTDISMYPKLWEASGIPQGKLLDILINLALERFDKEKKLKTSVS